MLTKDQISERNRLIGENGKKTRIKRMSQVCKTFKFKVDYDNLNAKQKECLKMMFVKAKWIYNYLLDKDIYTFDYKNLSNITHKDKNKNDVSVTIQHIGSSVKQSIIQEIVNQIKGLSSLKKKGHKIGKLKYKSEYNSINLKQYGKTHTIRGNKIKILEIKKPIRVRGLKQLIKYNSIDYANAKLLYDGNDYYISLTCFIPKEKKEYNNDIIGIDMGVATTLTLSDGTKYDISVGESEKLKRLQAKLTRQKKGSNNRYKTVKKIRKEYVHISNKKNDISNKIVNKILTNYKTIVIQDEQIGNWRQDGMSGSKIQHSILGRIKNKLMQNDRVVILDKWFPTTKQCAICGTKVELSLNDRMFECPNCNTKEDRDVHAAKNMIHFYQQYNRLDKSGTDQTSIKGPVKIAYNKFISKLAKQEDTTFSVLC